MVQSIASHSIPTDGGQMMNTDDTIGNIVFGSLVMSVLLYFYLLLGNGLTGLSLLNLAPLYQLQFTFWGPGVFLVCLGLFCVNTFATKKNTKIGSLLILAATFATVIVLAYHGFKSPEDVALFIIALTVCMGTIYVTYGLFKGE
jgi:hypothetical protein